MSQALQPHGGKVRVFFADEARFGQQGTLTNIWAKRGARPTAVKQTRYEWVYLYAAVEPATGASAALLMPSVNITSFEIFLQELSSKLQPDEHAVLIMDQAGWHTSPRVRIPDSITVLRLPPYSPELNPVENLWHYLKSHFLSNRAYADYDALLDAGATAWRSLTPELIQSVCRCEYLTHAIQR